jgi:hypothetical protein
VTISPPYVTDVAASLSSTCAIPALNGYTRKLSINSDKGVFGLDLLRPICVSRAYPVVLRVCVLVRFTQIKRKYLKFLDLLDLLESACLIDFS